MSTINLCLLVFLCFTSSFGEAQKDTKPRVASPTNFTPGPDISIDRFFTIDTTQLPAGDCNARPNSLVHNGTVTVILPPTIDEHNAHSLDAILTQTLKVSFPYLLEQVGVDNEEIPSLVERGIPLLTAATKEIVFIDHLGSNSESHLGARDIFDDIDSLFGYIGKSVTGGPIDIFQDIACGFFAASALPAYLVFAHGLDILNSGRTHRASTPDQDFFIFPLHGDISHRDGITIVYDANIPQPPRGLGGSIIGVTIGRTIYFRRKENTRFMEDSGFKVATRDLLHEFTHSKQYQAVGYSLPAFGTKYLFNFCKAGFNYEKNVMEQEAFTKEKLSLLFDTIGFQFATIWKKKNLQATLGLPTSRMYTMIGSSSGKKIFALPMQRGRMTITCSGTSCS